MAGHSFLSVHNLKWMLFCLYMKICFWVDCIVKKDITSVKYSFNPFHKKSWDYYILEKDDVCVPITVMCAFTGSEYKYINCQLSETVTYVDIDLSAVELDNEDWSDLLNTYELPAIDHDCYIVFGVFSNKSIDIKVTLPDNTEKNFTINKSYNATKVDGVDCYVTEHYIMFYDNNTKEIEFQKLLCEQTLFGQRRGWKKTDYNISEYFIDSRLPYNENVGFELSDTDDKRILTISYLPKTEYDESIIRDIKIRLSNDKSSIVVDHEGLTESFSSQTRYIGPFIEIKGINNDNPYQWRLFASNGDYGASIFLQHQDTFTMSYLTRPGSCGLLSSQGSKVSAYGKYNVCYSLYDGLHLVDKEEL